MTIKNVMENLFCGNVPESYALAVALAAFVTTPDWWLIDHPDLPAENVADAFLTIFENESVDARMR